MTRAVALALALVISLAAGVAACGGSPPGTGGPSEPGATVGPAATGVPAAIVTPAPETPTPEPGHELYGFVPYWEMDDTIADHIARTPLTTLALFSVTHRRNGSLATNQNGYRRMTGAVGDAIIAAARDGGARVELVYTSFGETKNRRFYAEPKAQERWLEELVDLVGELGLDGVNVDVEIMPTEQIPAYADFVGRLRAALREQDPKAQVSVSTTSGPGGAAMAAAAALAGADRIFLMGYDYHWEGSDPGASAPIEQFDGKPANLVASLDAYATLGVPVQRTILGLPLYGVRWPVAGPYIGSPSTGRGDDWVPRRNLRVLEDPDFEPSYEPVESVEFYSVPGETEDAWDAVYYDSPRSLSPKLALADDRGLAGAGFWAIGYERGLPAYTELMKRFRAGALEAP